MAFGWVHYDDRRPVSDERVTVCFDDVDDEIIWDMLLSELDAANEYDELDFNEPRELIGISVDVPLCLLNLVCF